MSLLLSRKTLPHMSRNWGNGRKTITSLPPLLLGDIGAPVGGDHRDIWTGAIHNGQRACVEVGIQGPQLKLQRCYMKTLFVALLLLIPIAVHAQSSVGGGVSPNAVYFNVTGCTTWHFQAQSKIMAASSQYGQLAVMQTAAFDPYNSISLLVSMGGASYTFPLTKALGAKADLIYFQFDNDGSGSCFGRLMGDSIKANWPKFPIQ